MTWKDENIDKLFQDASKEKSFEFKEEYWNELETMLPKKKKRKFPFVWLFGSLFIFGTFSTLLISNKNLNQAADTIDPINKHSESAVKIAANISTQKKSSNSIKKKKINEPINSSKLSINEIFEVFNDQNTENQNEKEVKSFEQKESISNLDNKEIKSIVQIENSKGNVDRLKFLPISTNQLNSSILESTIFNSLSHKYSLYFDLSANMGQSMIQSNSLGSNFTKGIGIASGINYSSKFWSLSAGLSTSFSSIDNLYVKERVKIYGFGVQNFDNETKYKQLFSVEMPIMLGLKKKNHTIQFGLVPSFLMSSKISFESKTNNEIYTSSSLYGYRTGLVNFGLKPTVGYLYKITPTIQIGGNVQIQLISQIETGIFEGIQNSLPINGQLFIRKSILLK